ncbi:MAG: DNA polymerase III subunit alpha [Chitinophagales bacterium]|nr:DNA polymerase III subunit alpha [Chitinophagales bacterium]
MLLNTHSYYSLRYGTLSLEDLIKTLKSYGYDSAVLTDINNSSGVLDFIKLSQQEGFHGIAGMEYRNGDELLYIGIARNEHGFRELNDLMSKANLSKQALPITPLQFENVFIIYPFHEGQHYDLRDNEFIGIKPAQLTKLHKLGSTLKHKLVMLQPMSFLNRAGFKLHCQLRAINNNILFSQLEKRQVADRNDIFIPKAELLELYKHYPHIIQNTHRLIRECSFDFDFTSVKNKQTYTSSRYNDRELLHKLAYEGMYQRYGRNNPEAKLRVDKEIDIIDKLGFASYFLITWDIVRYAKARNFYHVGRGSGANSVVAYCLRITDVCPIELDLYFERFLNPKRKSPPDFDIDFSWDERDDVYDYIFKRYGSEHVALMGAMSTFKDRSIIREMGKVYGLPKSEIDMLVRDPLNAQNKHEITDMIKSVYGLIESFPNQRTIHASGVLISELPITYYTALDMPPKGFQTAQIDMYTAEDIGFEKFDILSQRGIGHIKETAHIVRYNQGVSIDVHDIARFTRDRKVRDQLKKGDSIGCFYIESPAMRQLLKKLKCDDYLTLVAASSIIRPGVASSGMMGAYIERFHDPSKTKYLHPIMEQQLKETFGVMVYQEDVLKIGHYFGGLDLADADFLRRMMSGKHRGQHHLKEIERKYFQNTKAKGISFEIAKEVWRQIESFAGYSFSKAHSASFAVESFQSLYLKTYYPLEFMTAVINNFGGFYRTWVYVHEARKAGATINLPCINTSEDYTLIHGTDIYLGFIHIKSLEINTRKAILDERRRNGPYLSLENFVLRTGEGLEQLVILIRIGAFRFTGTSKKELLWEAHNLLNAPKNKSEFGNLFYEPAKTYKLPKFESIWIEDVYDELELLSFPVTRTMFDLTKSDFRGDVMKEDMIKHIGKTVRMVGTFVADKAVHTKRGEWMKFGTFIDAQGDFFDTTHFPQSLSVYPLNGTGIYLIEGKVVQDFGFTSLEVDKCGKMSVVTDPRC